MVKNLPLPINPCFYQVHALSFLNRIRNQYGRSLSLLSVPEKEWTRLVQAGFDAVWLMGVWQRSPQSQRLALSSSDLRKAFDRALPGWTKRNVAGSCYSIRSYALDRRLGEKNDLAKLKKKLNSLGLKLILDFVPNHLAADHPWVKVRERFIRGSKEESRLNPALFFKSPGSSLYTAHGKDPYFPAWSDTAQINIFSKPARKALIGELMRVASVCDGVRCDMAMLLLNRIFRQTWGKFLARVQEPEGEFWPEAIAAIKGAYPEFVFIAEVYWDLEWQLQQLGFDYTYDKRLYDLLRASGPWDVRNYLRAESAIQQKMVRFVENHDEARASVAFGPQKSLAAAAVVATVPGLRLIHEGQPEGNKIHFPIHLDSRLPEPEDSIVRIFYDVLLSYIRSIDRTRACWILTELGPIRENDSAYQRILGWSWVLPKKRKLILINYSDQLAEGTVKIAFEDKRSKPFRFRDWLSKSEFTVSTEQLSASGYPIRLDPWAVRLFDVD